MIENVNIFQIFPKFLLEDADGYAMCKALEAGLKYGLAKMKEGLDTALNVDRMPEWRLDEMAWETNCLYEYTADVEMKREWIRNATPWYSLYGTPEVIRKYLTAVYDNPVVEEYWQYSTDPFHFRVTVDGEYTEENAAWVRKAVEKTKNVRSVLDTVIFNGGTVETEMDTATAATGLAVVENVEMIANPGLVVDDIENMNVGDLEELYVIEIQGIGG